MIGENDSVELLKQSYDWQCAFSEAIYHEYRRDTVEIENIKRIVCAVDGENDESNWVGVFEMNDGRYLSISAGCDYTGWD